MRKANIDSHDKLRYIQSDGDNRSSKSRYKKDSQQFNVGVELYNTCFLKIPKNESYINQLTYKFLHSNNGILSRAYGLLKMHKSKHSLKIIVSHINRPLYAFSLFLHKLICNNISPAQSNIFISFYLLLSCKVLKFSEYRRTL